MSDVLVKQFIFFIDGDKLKSFRYNGKEFELMKYKGDDYYSSADNLEPFWRWWKEVVGFTKEDCYNFCFLSTNEKLNINLDYYFSNENQFNIESIKRFLGFIKYPKIQLINKGNKQNFNISFENISDFYTENKNLEVKKIYLTTFPDDSILEKKDTALENEEIEEISSEGVLFRYYNKVTEGINKN